VNDPISYQPFPKLSRTFVEENLRVDWNDLAWAATNHWLDAKSLADLADGLARDNDALRVAIHERDLADDEAGLRSILVRQAKREGHLEAAAREHWLHVAVVWVYEHRSLFDDPWAILEEIWEAFGHPKSINGLVRWMPVPIGESAGGAAMMERWKKYVGVT
jgi:hypothetical protein